MGPPLAGGGALARGGCRSTLSHRVGGAGTADRPLGSARACPVLVMLTAPFRATLPQPFRRACSPASWRRRWSGLSGACGRSPLRGAAWRLPGAAPRDGRSRFAPAVLNERRGGRGALGGRSSPSCDGGGALALAERAFGRGFSRRVDSRRSEPAARDLPESKPLERREEGVGAAPGRFGLDPGFPAPEGLLPRGARRAGGFEGVTCQSTFRHIGVSHDAPLS